MGHLLGMGTRTFVRLHFILCLFVFSIASFPGPPSHLGVTIRNFNIVALIVDLFVTRLSPSCLAMPFPLGGDTADRRPPTDVPPLVPLGTLLPLVSRPLQRMEVSGFGRVRRGGWSMRLGVILLV